MNHIAWLILNLAIFPSNEIGGNPWKTDEILSPSATIQKLHQLCSKCIIYIYLYYIYIYIIHLCVILFCMLTYFFSLTQAPNNSNLDCSINAQDLFYWVVTALTNLFNPVFSTVKGYNNVMDLNHLNIKKNIKNISSCHSNPNLCKKSDGMKSYKIS